MIGFDISQRERRLYNCPNCGAPLSKDSEACVYCGTLITWIPSANIYFTPKMYDRQVLEARATIDLDILKGNPGIEGMIKEKLAAQMAHQIPDVWDIKYDDDPIRYRRLYIARLPVWVERK